MFYEPDEPDDMYTWEGFQAFASRPAPVRPKTLTLPQLKALGDVERAIYDRERHIWHTRMTVATPDYQAVQDQLSLHLRVNAGGVSPRPAAAVNGHSGQLGKSWAAERFAAKFELKLREETLQAVDRGLAPEPPTWWVPTALCVLSGASTVKGLNKQILNFYGGPPPALRSVEDFTDAIARRAHKTATRLVLIDDVHNLDLGRKSHQEVSKHLKTLSQRMPCTFVYIGIGVGRFLNETLPEARAVMSQKRGRTTLVHLRRFEKPKPTPPGEKVTDPWTNLLANVESKLVLCSLRRRPLTAHAELLWRRSGGTVGVLMLLVRELIAEAIRTGREDFDESHIKAALIPDIGWEADDGDDDEPGSAEQAGPGAD